MKQPKPPSLLRSACRSIVYVLGFGVGGLLIVALPFWVYLTLFHPDRLVPAFVDFYPGLHGPNAPLLLLVIAGIVAGLTFFLYQRERGTWRAFQELPINIEAEDVYLPPPERRVELPAPAPVPATPVVLGDQRGVSGVLFPILAPLGIGGICYFLWSMSLFTWPPIEQLTQTIIALCAILTAFTAAFFWRGLRPKPITFDNLGITLTSRSGVHLIPWGDVRHLLLLAMMAQEHSTHDSPAEHYQFWFGEAEVLDLDAHLYTGMVSAAALEKPRATTRAAIALAMQRTRLPLIADSDDLREREGLLTPQRIARSRRNARIFISLLALGAAAFAALAVGFFGQPQQYHPVTGTLASYSVTEKELIVSLAHDPATYSLFLRGTSPYPPETLPAGTTITMQVSDQRIGVLDAETPSQRWHIVTLSYAQPWLLPAMADAIAIFMLAAALTLGTESTRGWRAQAPKQHGAR